MKMFNVLVLVCVMLGMTGCGESEPTIDFTSKETAKASEDKMKEGLSAADKAKLAGSLQYVSMSLVNPAEILKAIMGGKKNAKETEAKKVLARLNEQLGGMTASEIIAYADKLRADHKARGIDPEADAKKQVEDMMKGMGKATEEGLKKGLEGGAVGQ